MIKSAKVIAVSPRGAVVNRIVGEETQRNPAPAFTLTISDNTEVLVLNQILGRKIEPKKGPSLHECVAKLDDLLNE